MRTVQKEELQHGATPIEDIKINPGSRDALPAVLRTLQELYMDNARRKRLFAILEDVIPQPNENKGRSDMPVWTIFALAMLKQHLRCTFDRLQNYANHYDLIRQMNWT